MDSSVLSDVYHGKIWKEFLNVDGVNFLSCPFSYGLMMNIDWFQPFDHYTYSVGIIYLVILNLPRSQRYKRQNVIIIGVIPGPHEPPLTINSYLSPLVVELNQLWSGIELKVNNCNKIVRAALLGVACDMPASKKVCGFLSHAANLGCSRCRIKFSVGPLRCNYANLDRSTWTARSNSSHRRDVDHLLQNSHLSISALSKMEAGLGCRYSVLLKLPYFDPVRMTIIDPMHNFFLGSAKHITKDILIGAKILDRSSIDLVHKRLKKTQLPVDMGRLPLRVDSGSTYTAEQWMNWTLYFSIYCLHGLLNNDQIECWRHFVLACRRLCKLHITEIDIKIADLLLLQFCRRVKHIYGPKYITPNMHNNALPFC